MTPEQSEHFYKSYPNLFRKPIYFECGPGWFELLDELCHLLERMIRYSKTLPINEGEGPCVVQIKEKYGALRFYMNSATDDIYAEIDKAEEKSHKICEVCGKVGKMKTENNWMSVRCEECLF
jgi:hypothetical protein